MAFFHFFVEILYFASIPVPFTEVSVAEVERQLRNGDGPTFFTDGSCLAPTTPTIAMAAWAIVLSNVVEDEDRIRTVNQGVQIDNLSSSFSTVAVARCHGQQSVDRAELLAVTHLFEQWNRTRLVTDSDYVRKSVNAVLQTSDVTTLAMKPNADLLYRLFAALPNSDHQIIKVESHVLEGRIPKQNHFRPCNQLTAAGEHQQTSWNKKSTSVNATGSSHSNGESIQASVTAPPRLGTVHVAVG